MKSNSMIGRRKGREGRGGAVEQPETCLLCELNQGESATITEISAAYSHAALLEGYGLAAGTWVVRERTLPLGDPIVFRVEGRPIALRREDALHISVRRKGAE